MKLEACEGREKKIKKSKKSFFLSFIAYCRWRRLGHGRSVSDLRCFYHTLMGYLDDALEEAEKAALENNYLGADFDLSGDEGERTR